MTPYYSRMEDEDYRIIKINDNMIKCFRDGRIFTMDNRCKKYDKWNERTSKPHSRGYVHIQIGSKQYKAHRLIMMAFVGESEQEVDHINRIKTDNRFENLRYCSRRENIMNRDYVDNAKGYSWAKKKWRAQINVNGKMKYLGYFDNEQEAHQAYLDAKELYRNEQ
jgi:hypothetical protein